MKVTINALRPIAVWKWDTSTEPHKLYHYSTGGIMDDDDEDEECGICRLAFESCCPSCKMPGDDCPLIWGTCTHVFHMHCLLKWLDTDQSREQCPLDRRTWETADRKPDRLPTTVDGAPVATMAPGLIHGDEDEEMGDESDDGVIMAATGGTHG
ncbi:hypothetical protein CcaverHIS002_0304670 [Cutaneotrichosporon cavernicola]|uniref:Anaphase-promoting complex subunit 11 n=1 Tax=Cutaneotrichosporon cavernicola TaxID=279322 RepID=A0AA48IIZ0_9TREE|nr:uncharacterized protein CcaverHIS019_0304630 [Cutaneotrichosporon cavernicola]BEI82599.1 hypothetical protein CcaverHIS002_0304670 [Cutaneotrichosporon cavernicola]BEI90393.1 hypothetical protein CcaverHIS019_0304630 [Cutaneotrichosporon cavernicola]BEI98169.1 hypothetical protein CcaverHIS631_0304680 [Cutaneotrichosporon cavernicola]BEJ05946.1 hypothetical protein CcaverHIS641_0304680 [Cutaneotrichosporon cavernicola]